MSSQNFSTYFLQAPYTGRSKVSHTLCVCVIGPCSVSFACIPFVVKVSQRENEWQASLLPLPILVIASYFSPIESAARLAVFLREPATGTWPAQKD